MISKTAAGKKKNDQAALALGKIGPDATPTIMAFLEKNNPLLDWQAVLALKGMSEKPREPIPYLLILMRGKDMRMRHRALDYLLSVDPPTAEINEFILQGIEDRDYLISQFCLEARARGTLRKSDGLNRC